MTTIRCAYMPLATYPEAAPDEAIRTAAAMAAALGCALEVATFEVRLPRVSSGWGDLLIDIPGLARTGEAKSKSECRRLEELIRSVAASNASARCRTHKVDWGKVPDEAAAEARYFDLSLIPWTGDTVASQGMAEALIFETGRPVILVPPAARPAPLSHIAVAWDGSRVAARALGDALPLLAEGGQVSVLTVGDEKPLKGFDLAERLASALGRRGYDARPLNAKLGKMAIGEALQYAARNHGAQLLAMGGFGHSRLRDFVLGGATKGILDELRLPVLISH